MYRGVSHEAIWGDNGDALNLNEVKSAWVLFLAARLCSILDISIDLLPLLRRRRISSQHIREEPCLQRTKI